MIETTSSRPLPELRNFGAEFWRAAARGVLAVPKCTHCGETFWHPRPHCPHCGSAAIQWVATSGEGVVHTFTIVRQSDDPFFKTRVPYVVAMVVLDEGIRLMLSLIHI